MSQVRTWQLGRAMARLQSHGVHIYNEETVAQASQKFLDEIHTMPSAERSTIQEKAHVSHNEVWQTTFRVSSKKDSCDLRMVTLIVTFIDTMVGRILQAEVSCR